MQLIGRLMQARKVDNGTTNWWDVPPKTLAEMVVNAGLAPSVQSGATGAMPAAGVVGRIYLATDSRLIYRDTGSAWETYPPPGAVGGATETTAGVLETATQTEVNTGTDDARAVTPLKLASRTGTDQRAGVVSLSSSGTNVALAQNDGIFSDYISGLSLEWVSATQIRVNPGACYIPSLGRIYNIPTAINITPTLTGNGNAWLSVYIYDSAGTPFAEALPVAPSVPYKGWARTKTGDNSRRYVGGAKVNAAGTAILKFIQDGSEYFWLEDTRVAPLQVVAAGATSSPAAANCTGAVSPASSRARVFARNPSSSFTLFVAPGNANYTLSSSLNYWSIAPGGARSVAEVALNASKQFFFMNDATSSGAEFCVMGYTEYV